MALASLCCCASVPDQELRAEGCEGGAGCRVVGQLSVLPGGHGAGSIQTPSECFDLALPPHILKNHARWHKQIALVEGEVIHYPGSEMLDWIDVRDRTVAGGGCSSKIIYVRMIELVD